MTTFYEYFARPRQSLPPTRAPSPKIPPALVPATRKGNSVPDQPVGDLPPLHLCMPSPSGAPLTNRSGNTAAAADAARAYPRTAHSPTADARVPKTPAAGGAAGLSRSKNREDAVRDDFFAEVKTPSIITISPSMSFSYGTGRASLRNATGETVRFHAAEITGISGPSGGGKTTLLRLICGEESARGAIQVSGAAVRLLPDGEMPEFLPVREVIRLRAKMVGLTGIDLQDAVDRAVSIAGVEDAWLPLKPPTLSSGQRMRVALAMCLTPMPRILLLDEVDAHLDARAAIDIYQRLRCIADQGVAIVAISHNSARLLALVDRLIVIKEGSILRQQGGCRNRPLAQLQAFIGEEAADV